jgi:hypothetical protein
VEQHHGWLPALPQAALQRRPHLDALSWVQLQRPRGIGGLQRGASQLLLQPRGRGRAGTRRKHQRQRTLKADQRFRVGRQQGLLNGQHHRRTIHGHRGG